MVKKVTYAEIRATSNMHNLSDNHNDSMGTSDKVGEGRASSRIVKRTINFDENMLERGLSRFSHRAESIFGKLLKNS